MEIELISASPSPLAKSLSTLLPACGIYVRERAVRYRADARVVVCDRPSPAVATACKEAKQGGPPVFVLAERGSGLDQVNCLQLGAHRAYAGAFAIPRLVHDLAQVVAQPYYTYGRLVLSDAGASWNQMPLHLSRKQLIALRLLANCGCVTRAQLATAVHATLATPAAIDALIGRLKQRLPLELREKIISVYGIGYRLDLSE